MPFQTKFTNYYTKCVLGEKDLHNTMISRQKDKEDLLVSFLELEYPDVACKLDQLLDIDTYDRVQLIGQMMSGKTESMIVIHHIDIVFHQMFCMHVVPESGDIPQFELSVMNYNTRWSEYTKSQCKSVLGDKINLVFSRDIKLASDNELIVTEQLSAACRFNRMEHGCIVVVLGHSDQLYRQTKLICDVHSSENHMMLRDCNIIFDESHVTMFPNTLCEGYTYDNDSVFSVLCNPFITGVWPETVSKYSISTHLLRSFSKRVTGCSATACMNMLDEDNPLKCVITVNPKKHYRSVFDQEYVHIDEETFNSKCFDIDDDPSLVDTIDTWASEEPLPKKQYGLTQDHPIFALIQVSRLVDIHEAINDHICDTHTDKFVTIVQNNNGIKITFPADVADYIKSRRKSTVVLKNMSTVISEKIDSVNSVLFKRTPLHCVLQYLSELKSRVKRIVLIAGNCVKQGRRINSTDYKLGLTDEFIRDQTSALDTACQKLRIVGYRPDKRYTRVHCIEDFHEQIIQSHMLNTELISKVINDIEVDTNCTVQEVIEKTTVSKSKVPKRRLCKKANIFQITTDPIDDLFEGLNSTI